MSYRYQYYDRPSEQVPATPAPPTRGKDTLMAWFIHAFQVVAAFALVLFALWGLLFGMVITAMAALAAALVFSARTEGGLTRWLKILLLGALVGGAAAFHQVPTDELEARNQALAKTLQESGPQGLDLRDNLGVYGLHLLVASSQLLVGQPHAAREGWALCWPGDKKRDRNSGFPMRSPRVRKALVAAITELERKHPTDGKVELTEHTIPWDYPDGVNAGLPFSLPVQGPLTLTGGAERDGSLWTLYLTATGSVAHPDRRQRQAWKWRADVPRLFDESLFQALEENGWLHPYIGRWHWTVTSKDPRLAELKEPLSSHVEGWLAQALAWVHTHNAK